MAPVNGLWRCGQAVPLPLAQNLIFPLPLLPSPVLSTGTIFNVLTFHHPLHCCFIKTSSQLCHQRPSKWHFPVLPKPLVPEELSTSWPLPPANTYVPGLPGVHTVILGFSPAYSLTHSSYWRWSSFVQSLALPLTDSVTLRNVFQHSVPQFSYLGNGHNGGSHLIGLFSFLKFLLD